MSRFGRYCIRGGPGGGAGLGGGGAGRRRGGGDGKEALTAQTHTLEQLTVGAEQGVARKVDEDGERRGDGVGDGHERPARG